MPKCSKCKETKDRTGFYKDKHRKNGLSFYCKACHTRYKKEKKEKNLRDFQKKKIAEKNRIRQMPYYLKFLKIDDIA